MHALIHPLFGDLMVDGAGSVCLLFVLFLAWDAWLQKREHRQMAALCKQARQQYVHQRRAAENDPPAGGIPLHQRGALDAPVRIFKWKFALLSAGSMIVVLLVKGNEKPAQPEAAVKPPGAVASQTRTADNNGESTTDSASRLWDTHMPSATPHAPVFDADGAHLWEAYTNGDSSEYTPIAGGSLAATLTAPPAAAPQLNFSEAVSADQTAAFSSPLNRFSH